MKRALVSAVVASSLASLGVGYPTDLVARDKSSRDGGVSVGSGGASVNAGGTSVSAGRGGASVGAAGTSVSADRGDGSASVGRDGASGSGGAHGTSVSADRGGASVSGGGTSVSADRGDADVGNDGSRKAPVTAASGGDGVRSYDSIGDWFRDLRSMFSPNRKDSNVATQELDKTINHSSAAHTTQRSESDQTQFNRVIQSQSSTEIATEGSSASAEASNVSETEQKN